MTPDLAFSPIFRYRPALPWHYATETLREGALAYATRARHDR